MCKRIFKFELQLSSYWQNIKFSRYCPKFHILTNIVIFQVYLQLFRQLLHPYKFYGRDMSGILFFIFASCEPEVAWMRPSINLPTGISQYQILSYTFKRPFLTATFYEQNLRGSCTYGISSFSESPVKINPENHRRNTSTPAANRKNINGIQHPRHFSRLCFLFSFSDFFVTSSTVPPSGSFLNIAISLKWNVIQKYFYHEDIILICF